MVTFIGAINRRIAWPDERGAEFTGGVGAVHDRWSIRRYHAGSTAMKHG